MQEREFTITITGKYKMPEHADDTNKLIDDIINFRETFIGQYPGVEFTLSDEPYDGETNRMVARCPICSGIIMQGLIYEPETQATSPTRNCASCKTAISAHLTACPSCGCKQQTMQVPLGPPGGIPH